ncbi:Por secretion system C-terminal sorting domain-containing protein [Spirosomataceae bacterium TFI 002]|nr:Por secretion system C-terminal sorting domain-containing protein [Spirosomataceae bacterium TFI 002]
MKKILLTVSITCLSLGFSFGQGLYLVKLKDKTNSTYSLSNPNEFLSQRAIERRQKQGISITEQDFPVNKTYLSQITSQGVKVVYSSRWLNAVLIDATQTGLEKVLALPFSNGIEGNGDVRVAINSRKSNINVEEQFIDIDPGTSRNQLEMLGVDQMHKENFTGKGVLIGILDSGFSNADKLDVFKDIFTENRVLDTYDFVNRETNVYNDHTHGTNVWSCIGAKLDGQLLGTAPDASFALFKTEDVYSETRLEEANWLFAAERADSLGVDVINTSLGYTTFDNSNQNYSYQDLNGDKALITRAADWAASKGIVVVVSAGNSGNDAWRYIGTPADADSVISVGAVDADQNYASFSSIGPRVDGMVKPEVSAKGSRTTLASHQNSVVQGNGTSFSAPLIAGMMADFIQAFPNLTAMELRDILIQSSSLFGSPNELIGHGIPSYLRAKDIANIQNLIKSTDKDVLVFPNPSVSEEGLKVLVIPENYGSSFEAAIYDLTGRVVFQNNFNNKIFQININKSITPSGSYVLKVWNENFSFSEKIMVN